MQYVSTFAGMSRRNLLIHWLLQCARSHMSVVLLCASGLTPEGLHQAFHAQLMLHSHLARAAGVPLSDWAPELLLPILPEPLHSQALEGWRASAQEVRVSKLQADVSSTLLLAGIPNVMEWLTDDGLLSIDIAFQVRDCFASNGYGRQLSCCGWYMCTAWCCGWIDMNNPFLDGRMVGRSRKVPQLLLPVCMTGMTHEVCGCQWWSLARHSSA